MKRWIRIDIMLNKIGYLIAFAIGLAILWGVTILLDNNPILLILYTLFVGYTAGVQRPHSRGQRHAIKAGRLSLPVVDRSFDVGDVDGRHGGRIIVVPPTGAPHPGRWPCAAC